MCSLIDITSSSSSLWAVCICLHSKILFVQYFPVNNELDIQYDMAGTVNGGHSISSSSNAVGACMHHRLRYWTVHRSLIQTHLSTSSPTQTHFSSVSSSSSFVFVGVVDRDWYWECEDEIVSSLANFANIFHSMPPDYTYFMLADAHSPHKQKNTKTKETRNGRK